MRLLKLLSILAILFNQVIAEATNSDDLHFHYYLLRSMTGGSEFAGSLHELRNEMTMKNVGWNGIGAAESIIHFRPKGPNSGDNSPLVSDALEVGGALVGGLKFPVSTALVILGNLVYSGSDGKTPMDYQRLAFKSEEEVQQLRDDVMFFVAQKNAGNLTKDEQNGVDLLFRYYTGVSLQIDDATLLNDPLMLPFKMAQGSEKKLTQQLNGLLKVVPNVAKQNQAFGELLERIENSITDSNAREVVQSKLKAIHEAATYADVDIALNEFDKLNCDGGGAEACNAAKNQANQLAVDRKSRISHNEIAYGIDQGINLGLQFSNFTKNKDMTQMFQALNSANQARQGVLAGLDNYSSASTWMGKFGALASVGANVTTAVSFFQLLSQGNQPTEHQELIESLAELKKLIVDLTVKVENGFNDMAARSDRLSSLVSAYAKVGSKNDAVLQQDISSLRQAVKGTLQPLHAVMLDYLEDFYNQFKSFSKQVSSISSTLPDNSQLPLRKDNQRALENLFYELFAINAAVEKGQYKIAIDTERAVAAHFELVKTLAQYPSGPFQSAFLLQNAMNATSNGACGAVNLIGFMMVSEASIQVNSLLDKLSHKQLSDFFEKSEINKREFNDKMQDGVKYISAQRDAVESCVNADLLREFETAQIDRTSAYIEYRLNNFFNDGNTLNNILIALVESGTDSAVGLAPGGFVPDRFSLGHFIAETRSFNPQDWDKIIPSPFVHAIGGLGTKGIELNRRDFELVAPRLEFRLAQYAGTNAEYVMETGMVPHTDLSYNPYVFPVRFQLTLVDPRNEKVINAWAGKIPYKLIKDKSLVEENNKSHMKYFKLAKDSLPGLYQSLEESGTPLFSMLDFVKGMSSLPYNHSFFFTNPGLEWSRDYAPFESLNNDYTTVYEHALLKYVAQLSEIVNSQLAGCLEIRLSNGVCDLNGLSALTTDESDQLQAIENYGILRMTLDPNSDVTQRVLDLDIRGNLERKPVVESGASVGQGNRLNDIMGRVAAFQNKLKDTKFHMAMENGMGNPALWEVPNPLDYPNVLVLPEELESLKDVTDYQTPQELPAGANAYPVPTELVVEESDYQKPMKLPKNVTDALENDYDWLDARLRPYLAN